VDDDPLEGLREAVGDAFEGTDSAGLKAEARESIAREVEDEAKGDASNRGD
jgi:hypothetical protein